MFYNWLENVYGLKDIWFLLLAPLDPLSKGPAPFSWCHIKGRPKLHHFCSTCYHNIFMSKELSMKDIKKSDAFSNSIFEPYRASALFELETWDSFLINFSPLSIFRENLKKISCVVTEIIAAQNETLKIRKSSISPTGSDAITRKIIFDLSRPIYTIPENFMKIRPGVLEKSSKKKKKE